MWMQTGRMGLGGCLTFRAFLESLMTDINYLLYLLLVVSMVLEWIYVAFLMTKKIAVQANMGSSVYMFAEYQLERCRGIW